jgi:hypothetical protein
MKLPFENGGLKFIISLFLTSLFVPLLLASYWYGRLSDHVDSMQIDLQRNYATKLELEKLNGNISNIKVILEHAPWYDSHVRSEVDVLQRALDERLKRRAAGYADSTKESPPPG